MEPLYLKSKKETADGSFHFSFESSADIVEKMDPFLVVVDFKKSGDNMKDKMDLHSLQENFTVLKNSLKTVENIDIGKVNLKHYRCEINHVFLRFG